MKKLLRITSAILLSLFISTAVFADQKTQKEINPKVLIGTWVLTGKGQQYLWTGHVDQTYICTYPERSESVCHGMYKKIGKNKYEATDWSFTFSENGKEKYLIETISEFTLQRKNEHIIMKGNAISILLDPKTNKQVNKPLTKKDVLPFTGRMLNIKPFATP
ncbi:MAG: hypothetical protein GY710_14090 [Desulfobacteraceae bacterium]|nr:hypothetical protein [Desulfobacteraceae bacterium]